jgi:hypothetical protein
MFKPYQKFQSKLLEEIMNSSPWGDFLPTSLDESEKSIALSNLLRTGECEVATNVDSAKVWARKTLGLIETTQSLTKHCSRTANKGLRRWINFCEKVITTFKARPSRGLYELLERQSAHSKTLLENITKGRNVDGLAKELLSVMHRSITSHGIRIMESLVDHSKFVKSLEKEFSVKAAKYVPIRDGVFVYFDKESTDKLNDVVANYNSYITRISDEFGYLLLRKGTISDIEYGNFGEDTSCWMFVYAPITKEKEVGGEGEVLIKQNFKPLKLSERWAR